MLIPAFTGIGCATVTRGTTEAVSIQSEPTGAAVRLSNGFIGVTPVTFTLPRKGDIFVSVSKEGYQSQELKWEAQIAGAGAAGFVGNALIGGIIGGGVDVATGAALSRLPNPLFIKLLPLEEKAGETPPPPPSPTSPTPLASAPKTDVGQNTSQATAGEKDNDKGSKTPSSAKKDA